MTNHIQIGREYIWRSGAITFIDRPIVVTDIVVNSNDEVWIKSFGQTGSQWNSLDVFREQAVPKEGSLKDIFNDPSREFSL